jgi:ubiquinone biosynthesis protein
MNIFILIKRIFIIPVIFLKYTLKRSFIDEFGKKQKLTNPARLRFVFQDLGGVFMKFGQILAMRFDVLPIDYAMSLLNLLDNAPKIDDEKMFNVFKNETGKNIKEVFNNFNTTSIATASFAQVYKGMYNSEVVIIKIQKPSARKYIKSDLWLLGFITTIIDWIGILKAVTMRDILFQLKEWLKEELDYTIETCNNQTIYDHVKKHKLENVRIPKVYHEFATRKVLVQEFLNGFQVNKTINNLLENPEKTKRILKENNINPLEVANLFIRDIMRQYFIDGFFHADPHPANLMIFPNNKIGYMDFGIIGKLENDNHGMLKYIRASANLEFHLAAKGIVEFIELRIKKELGDTLRKKSFKRAFDIILSFLTEQLTEDFKPIINDWHFHTGNKELNLKDRSSAVTFLKVVKAVEKYHMKFPPDVIAFIRALLIIDMVCLKLSDNFNMTEAINLFFKNHSLDKIKIMSEEHTEEMERLHEILYASRSTEYIKNKEYGSKEHFIDIAYALAEKYPNLYNKMKGIKI